MDNKIQNNNNYDASTFEEEGIFLENDRIQEKDTDTEELNTEDIKKELLGSVDVEFKKTVDTEEVLTTGDIKKELTEGGIEILPNEPLDDGAY